MPSHNNNKYIIWVTILISVSAHLVMVALWPDFELNNPPPSEVKKTYVLSIIKQPKTVRPLEKVKPKTEKTVPKPATKKTASKKKVPKKKVPKKKVPKKKKPHEKDTKKAPPKDTIKKEKTSKAESKMVLGPSTSRKQKDDEQLSKHGGDRRKGELKGKKSGALKKSPEAKNKTTSKSTNKDKKQQSTSTDQKKEAITQTNPSSKNEKQQNKQNEIKSKPTQAPKNNPPNPIVLSTKSKKTTPQNKTSGRVSITQAKPDSSTKGKNSNPVFEAINQTQPISNISIGQIGNLKELQEDGLKEARLGDPLSNFEHKQRRVYNQFLARMSEQFEEQWQEPESGKLLLTSVRIYLSVEGFIKDIYTLQSSSDPIFDQEALRAIKAVGQFEMPANKTAAAYLTRLTMTVDNYSEPD